VDALGPCAELILALVGGELEEAVVDEDGLGLFVENGQAVGQQLCKLGEKLCLLGVGLVVPAAPMVRSSTADLVWAARELALPS
jgi:hypothetical protein